MTLFRIDPDTEEAQHERMVEDMQVENFGFVHPAWLAWTDCPLFEWLKELGLFHKWHTEETARFNAEWARGLGLMMIETERGIEFKKTAIVRRM